MMKMLCDLPLSIRGTKTIDSRVGLKMLNREEQKKYYLDLIKYSNSIAH